MSTQKHSCIGSSLDDFLAEEGILEEAQAEAIKSVISWQLKQFMDFEHVSKVEIAKRLGTSRSLVDKLLDSKNTSITLATMAKVAKLLGKSMSIQFGEHCSGQRVTDFSRLPR